MRASVGPSLESSLIRHLSLLYLGTILVAASFFLVRAWIGHDVVTADGLSRAAVQLGSFVVRDTEGTPRLELPDDVDQRLRRIPGFQVVMIDAATGRLIDGYSAPLAAQVAMALSAWTDATFFQTADGRPVQGVIKTIPIAGGPIRVAVVGEPSSLFDILVWARSELLEDVLPVLVPAMLMTLLIGAVTVRSAMAPLKRLSAEAAAIDPRLAGVQLAEHGVPREVLPLVQAVNRAIARIELALQQQRRMTANAAHELRTPLAILKARLDGVSDHGVRSALDRDVTRMARLVEQLMAVARLEAGQVMVERSHDLVRVVREVLADAAPLAMAQGRTLELFAPDRPVALPLNPMALGDALINLVDNALRHTAAGDCVEVSVEAPEGRAVIEVRDRGPGVPLAERTQIFEAFWRGRDQHGKGSGLGLAIVAETVAIHGGSVRVEDREGGGSVFRIELPMSQIPAPVTHGVVTTGGRVADIANC